MPVQNCFQWLGTGVARQRRKPSELHYPAFQNGDLFVAIDDYVLIRNDDSTDPEDLMNCYIGQVKDLYNTDDIKEPYIAKVQWYSRVTELKRYGFKELNTFDHDYEVVEEHRSIWVNMIDAESIFGKCVIVFLPVDSDATSVLKKLENGTPTFFCRYKFTEAHLMPKVSKTQNENLKVAKTSESRRSHRLLHNLSPGLTKSVQKEVDVLETDSKVSGALQANEVQLKPFVISIPKIENLIIADSIEDRKDILSPKKRFKVELSPSKTTRLRIKTLNISDHDSSPDISLSKSKSRKKQDKEVSSDLLLETTPCKSPTIISLRDSATSPKSKSTSHMRHSTIGVRCSPRLKGNLASIRKSPAGRRLATSGDMYSTPTKKDRSKRALDFGVDKDVNDSVVTTRYGRKVKSVDKSLHYLDLLLTPEKNVPKKGPMVRKNTKFYNSDVSDSEESAYHPDEGSSSDESGRVSPSEPVRRFSQRKSPAVKESTKKQSRQRLSKNSKSPYTPSLPQRRQPVKTPSNMLEESRQRLHVSSVPLSLPCRDEEYSDIYAFVESNLVNHTGGCMYVSGVPGTGKTATVHEVIRNLEDERDCSSLPPFQFIEVNGMKMTDPYQCYVQIYKALSGKRIAPQQAANMLEKRFTKPGPKNDAIILLVDELDKLWTRKQTVMYNIFDWPTKPGSKLIVIAIANTMDLPERMMMSRVSSRLGLTRKTFQPYTFRELQEIVMSRIRELNVFDPDAVQLVARKVAAVSGDARRALEICRRAAEVAEEGRIKVSPTKKKNILVGMAHVDAALNQMLSSPEVAAIRGCSEFQRIFFKALLAEFERVGNEETTLFKLYRQFVLLCRLEGLHPPTTSEVSAICSHLSSSHLILVDNFDNDLFMKLRLNVSIDDVSYALNGRIN